MFTSLRNRLIYLLIRVGVLRFDPDLEWVVGVYDADLEAFVYRDARKVRFSASDIVKYPDGTMWLVTSEPYLRNNQGRGYYWYAEATEVKNLRMVPATPVSSVTSE